MDPLTLRPGEQAAFNALHRAGLITPTLPNDTTEFISTRMAAEAWAQQRQEIAA